MSSNATAESTAGAVAVAVDDGFRQTKILTSNGFQASIPSIARSGFSITRLSGDMADGGYETEGKKYTVDSAIEGEDTRFDDYATSPINRVLVQHVMQLAGLGGKEVVLCTGVPFQTYFRQGSSEVNQELVEAKIRSLATPAMPLNGQPAPTLMRQQVMAQGLAAYIDYMTDDSGEFRPEVRRDLPYAVVDIGGRTTDCVTVLRGGESLDHAASGTGNLGVSNVYDLVAAELMRKFDTPRIQLATLDRVAREKTIRWRGQDHDVSALVDHAIEEIASQIIRELKRRIGDAGEMDAVLLVGGGAVLMHEALARVYPHAVLIDDPAFANARGMLKFVRWGASHG